MINPSRKRKIPSKEDWAGYENDLDVQYACKLMSGKSIEEVQTLFKGGRSIERASELLFMPHRAFQYYVFAFAWYVVSDAAAEDSDAASCFLRLLLQREEADAGSVSGIYDELASYVDFVATRQNWYDADMNIYGSFPELAASIKKLCCTN